MNFAPEPHISQQLLAILDADDELPFFRRAGDAQLAAGVGDLAEDVDLAAGVLPGCQPLRSRW